MLYPYQILLKADSETNFNLSGATIVLGKGEIGIAYDILNNFKGLKIGNGLSTWNSLTYLFNNLQDYYTQTQVNNISGLTNYYDKTQVYSKTEIDSNLNNNFYDTAEINYILSGYTTTAALNLALSNYVNSSNLTTILSDYTTIEYVGNIYNIMTGRTDFYYYYLKTETDAKYLLLNSGYTITNNVNIGGTQSSLYFTDYTNIGGNSTLLNLYHNTDNSSVVNAIFSQASGDYDVYTLYGKAFYKGGNITLNPSLMSIVDGIKGDTSFNASSKSVNAIGVYGNSSNNQVGNNFGVVGIAMNAGNSNIGVLGCVGTELQMKNLNGGVIGTSLYAYNSNASGYALVLDGGKLKVNGTDAWSGNIPVGAQTITVVNGIITNFA